MNTTPKEDTNLIWNDTEDPVNVLVLDDDPLLRNVVEQTLTRAGFNVMTAREGSEGLQVLLSNHFDVVVSDLMMEPMDGITFLTEALKIWPWMGVVIFSGYIREELYQQARELGVRHILEKPLAFDTLTRSVIAEARRMRSNVAGRGDLTLGRVLYQLNLLRDNTRTAIESASMDEALLNLCRDLGLALPSVLTAIMCKTGDDQKAVFAASMRRSVPPAFLDHIDTLIRKHYGLLSGDKLEGETSWALTGMEPDEAQPQPQAQPLHFPIISGSKITGILIFIAPDDFQCSESDISFLYHAANHFTTILSAFHRIRELAVRDELTGLYNRHHLQDELPGVWEMASRYGLNPAFLIIDVDHFKLINDNYGHAAGDEAMRTLAAIVRQTCRSSDLIARYGGDEIIAVLPDAEPGSIGKLAERMQKAISEHVFCPQSHAFHCTVSIGAASCRTPDGSLTATAELLNHADEALYTAKRNGRNRAIVWTRPEENARLNGKSPDIPIRPNMPSIIVVDDDPSVLRIVQLLLEAEKMVVQTCPTAANALEVFQTNPTAFDAALIDLNLEDMSGLELVRELSKKNPLLVSIIITGDATLDNALSSLRHGAYDFIQKPVQRNQLKVTLDRALDYHRLRMENEEYQQNLEAMVRRKSMELTGALKRTRDSLDFALRAMTAMLDAREHSTGAHSQRVQELTVLLAGKYGFDEKQIDGVRQGALLHDIGKIGVPDSILLKSGPLTEEEWGIMRNHVYIGYELIKSSPELQAAADIMLCHHEDFNGSGYPRGLKGDEIPLAARIFSVVDAYDAMRSTRPYRQGMPREQALAEIKQHSGTQFDPQVIEVFLANIDEVEAIGKWDNTTL